MFNFIKFVWIFSLTCIFLICESFTAYFLHLGLKMNTVSQPSVHIERILPVPSSHPSERHQDSSEPSVQVGGHPRNKKMAYLTFDDGPSALTPELLSALRKNDVRATFFVVGVNAQRYPDTLKQMVNDGDVIGVHSWTHNYAYIYKSTENFLADFNKLRNYISLQTGISPSICRFPGGTNNTVCFNYNKGHIMRQIVKLVQNMGFQYYDWNVSSGEASSIPPSEDAIVNNVITQCKGKNSTVILFHDSDKQDYVAVIPEIIAKLRSEGFEFDTLSPESLLGKSLKAVQFKPA